MNQLKNKLLMVIALSSIATNLIPHGGGGGFGGGFATGALLGTGITLAATSGSRNSDRGPAYYDYKDRERQRVEINREIRQHRKEINDHHKELRKLDRNKHLEHETREARRAEHKSAIQELEDKIEDLRRDLRNLF